MKNWLQVRETLLIPVNGSHVDKQTLERSNIDRVRSEILNGVVFVKTREHNRVFVAIDSLVTSRAGLAVKNGQRIFWTGMLYLARKERFPRELRSFQMTASSWLNSDTDLKKIY